MNLRSQDIIELEDEDEPETPSEILTLPSRKTFSNNNLKSNKIVKKIKKAKIAKKLRRTYDKENLSSEGRKNNKNILTPPLVLNTSASGKEILFQEIQKFDEKIKKMSKELSQLKEKVISMGDEGIIKNNFSVKNNIINNNVQIPLSQLNSGIKKKINTINKEIIMDKIKSQNSSHRVITKNKNRLLGEGNKGIYSENMNDIIRDNDFDKSVNSFKEYYEFNKSVDIFEEDASKKSSSHSKNINSNYNNNLNKSQYLFNSNILKNNPKIISNLDPQKAEEILELDIDEDDSIEIVSNHTKNSKDKKRSKILLRNKSLLLNKTNRKNRIKNFSLNKKTNKNYRNDKNKDIIRCFYKCELCNALFHSNQTNNNNHNICDNCKNISLY